MAAFSRSNYETLLYTLTEHYPEVRESTLRLYPNSRTTAIVQGSVFFANGLELRVFEYLDLSDGEIFDYSYTIYQGEQKIRWYDPQPHPENEELASTFPHHFYEEPGIKQNRKPADGISFNAPNLPNPHKPSRSYTFQSTLPMKGATMDRNGKRLTTGRFNPRSQ